MSRFTPPYRVLSQSAINALTAGQTTSIDISGLGSVSWVAWLSTLTGGAAPGVVVHFEHSPEGTNWRDIDTSASITATGINDATARVRVARENPLRHIRIRWEAATGGPSAATLEVYAIARQ